MFLLCCILSLFYVGQVELRNDKFLDYVDFVPLNLSHYSRLNSLNSFIYHYSPMIRSKSLNMSDPMEKKRQKEIVTRLIDSIVFDTSTDHSIGQLKSGGELKQLVDKYSNKLDLNTYRLEFLGLKVVEKRKFNHYIIIKKKLVKKSSGDQLTNRNLPTLDNSDNSLFYTYQNAPHFASPISFYGAAFNRMNNSKYFNTFNHNTNPFFQSKALNSDPINVFCSVFVQKNVKFGRKAIRIAFYQSMKNNVNETSPLFNSLLPQYRVHNIWITDGQRPFNTLKPIERIHTLSGLGMLYETV